MLNNEQENLSKEFEAWGKLERKLLTIETKLRSQEISSSAARKRCTARIHDFWNTIYQVRRIKPANLDRHPVSPYRVDPVTGEPRNRDDPEDLRYEELGAMGIVVNDFEKREDKVRRLVQELTRADMP